MLVPVFLALAVANGVWAQTSTASLFPLVQGDGMVGQVIGTGTDGTTYRLVGTFEASAIEIPFTATLVEDATHVSEFAILATSGVSIAVEAGCAFSSGEASCVQTLIQPSTTSALTVSGPLSLQGVPIVSGTGTVLPTISATGTGTGISTLPASITPSSSPASVSTATLITASGTSTGAGGEATSTSSAKSTFRLGVTKHVVLALAFGALSAFVMS